MSGYERKKVEIDLKAFTSKYLEKPSACRTPEQIRRCVGALSRRIGELERSCNYAPAWAYAMLAEYNERQNRFLFTEFTKSYC